MTFGDIKKYESSSCTHIYIQNRDHKISYGIDMVYIVNGFKCQEFAFFYMPGFRYALRHNNVYTGNHKNVDRVEILW